MIEAVLAFAAGLLLGSFLNVCIYRMPLDLSVVAPRSFCPKCEQTIRWYDNIPVLSYLLLRGHCRHCRAGISLRYPAVELLTAICFALVVYRNGWTPVALKFCVLDFLLIGMIFTDLEERILPDEFTLGGTVIGWVMSLVVPMNFGPMYLLLPMHWGRYRSLGESIVGSLVMSGSMWLMAVVYEKLRHKEGLGLGDVKMVAMLGAFLGMSGVLLTLVAGSLLGSVTGLLYIYVAKKDASTYELPFGSFLGIAGLVVSTISKVT